MVNRNPKPTGESLARLEEEILAQYNLEKWWVEDNKARDLEYAQVLREGGRATTDRGIRPFLIGLAERLAGEIREKVEEKLGGRPKRSCLIISELLKSIEPFELAYLVLGTATNAVMGSNKIYTPAATMATNLADALEQELRYRAMIALEPSLPGIVTGVLKDSRASVKHRRRVFTYLFHKKSGMNLPKVFTDSHSRIEVGNALLELLFTPSGVTLVELSKAFDTRKRDMRWVIKPSQQLLDIFYRDLDITKLAKFTAPLGILLYEPSKRLPGGEDTKEMLLTRDTAPLKVNILGGKRQSTVDLIIKNDFGYSALLEVLTYLEQTPVKINKRMLEYIRENKESLKGLGVLHSARLILPDCPFDKNKRDLSDQEIKKLADWKRSTEKAHNQFWKARVAVSKENRVLDLAEKLTEYSEFYYRWYADFRGRLYPLNSMLSFQSSSLAKSLLEFGGEPAKVRVGDAKDPAWCDLVEYGLRLDPKYSKVPTEQLRPLFSDEKFLQELVTQLEVLPQEVVLGGMKKKDYLPWVAWALHLGDLLVSWGQAAYTSHPIRKDATCSSMQHMGALAGEMDVLEATNCSSKVTVPQDLYTRIAPDYKERGLDRDWVKQFILTFAYNSTDYSRKNEIQDSFEEKYGVAIPREKAVAINDTLKEAALAGLGKVITLQEALMEVFRVTVVRNKLYAMSETLTGFKVDSTKFKYPERQYAVHHFGARIKLRYKNVDVGECDRDIRKTRQSWVANIIHSMDAALLQIAITGLNSVKKQRRYSLATIHDCIVTKPGDMADTLSALSFSFKYLYSPVPETGLPAALQALVDFWGLKKIDPALYRRFVKEFKGVPASTFDNMRYFFL